MKVFSIQDIPEFSKKERIVVVGVIGKSPYRYPNKAAPLVQKVQSDENGIECHWDERSSILYLHAVTYLDTVRLAELAMNLDENSKSTDKEADAAHWLVAAGELATDSCRIIALLFHLCHIVVLSSPTSVFDVGYLQLFKAIDAFRLELQPLAIEALTVANAGGAWESHGRSCCPRLLFHFRSAPPPLRKSATGLKRLEHAVEDQLYSILRKARIITNVCAKSLFAIPKNEEFVFISSEPPGTARDVGALVRGLVALCAQTPPPPPAERPSFKQFLQRHVDLAFVDGFDDNVGKYAMSTSFFQIPSAASWRTAAQVLTPLYLDESPKEDDASDPRSALYDALATDVRFSQARCAKVLPIAQASYAEGLPSHYSSQHHAHKVSVALGVVSAMGRGPLVRGARARLRAAAAALWGPRRLCEAASLSARPCGLPAHDSSVPHSSGARLAGACACGRSKAAREDPYTARDANYTCYVRAAQDCPGCDNLQTIEFPVFQPSTTTYKAASVKASTSQDAADTSEVREDGLSVASNASGRSGWSHDALSPGSGAEDDEEEAPSEENYAVVAVRANTSANSDKAITRQPSTTEYLPGMLHLGSPAGLLPAFPSWSLHCIGASSLYSHSAGLSEHLQPGFLPHTNFLVPWDCAVRMEQAAAWRAARGRGKAPAHHLTVKIFIGFEYECVRGHRSMQSGGTTGGAALAASSPALHAPCLCRGAAPAQLMRVHVVTPKAPVHVTLDPRVQPVPNGPIFVPQPAGSPPIKLSASAYWVLRLPYAYCDERGPLPKPKPGAPQGSLLAPLFGLED